MTMTPTTPSFWRSAPPRPSLPLAGSTMVSLCLVALGGMARGDDSGAKVDLQWIAPDGCASQAAILADIAQILGEPGRGHRGVTVYAMTQHEGAVWHATVSIRTSLGAEQRDFDADSCAAIAHAVALIAALAVDDRAVVANSIVQPEGGNAAATDTEHSTTSGPPSPPQPESAATPSSSPSPEVGEPRWNRPRKVSDIARSEGLAVNDRFRSGVPELRPFLWLGIGGDSATLHAPSGAAEIAVGMVVVGRSYSARFDGRGALYGPSTTATVPVTDEEFAGEPEGGDFRLFTLGARGCIARTWGSLEVGPCAGGEVDVVRASAFGGTNNPGATSSWGALVAGGFGAFAITPRLSLRVEADGVFPLARRTFVVETSPPAAPIGVFPAAPISARAFIGTEVRFF